MFAADLRLFLLVCEGPEVSDARENYEGIFRRGMALGLSTHLAGDAIAQDHSKAAFGLSEVK